MASGNADAEYMTLMLVMAVSAFLSMLGSIAVMRISYLKLTSTYQRFLFMLSLADLFHSAFLGLNQFLVPASNNYPWSFGGSTTCRMGGFFLHYGSVSVAMTSCFLSIYFFCSIQSSPKRAKLPEDIIGLWEWLAHISSLLVPAAIAGAMVGVDVIHLSDNYGLCSLTTTDDDDLASILGWVFLGVLGLFSLTSIAATLSVMGKVRSTLSGGPVEDSLNDEMKQRLRAVSTQAVLYTAVFVNTFLWPAIVVALAPDATISPPFGLLLVAFLFFPLQGMFNCLIYIRPRFQMLRSMYPNDSFFVVFRVSMSKAGDPDEIEDVREQIYGDKYEPPSVMSSVHSLGSDIPPEVAFDPDKPLSETSLVSAPKDDDDMDPEANNNRGDDDAKSS
eukprot:Nitzschia sp. Nitz4//scaffold12_size214221//184728//185894//NITZ4_001530-RA/size214221-processed-gene-0.180-mRNA-1//-1//CDS//3329535110//1512//frame0